VYVSDMDGERERERLIYRERVRGPFIKLHINRGALRSIADAIKLLLVLTVHYALPCNNRLHGKR